MKKIFIGAGEESSDILGEAVLLALKKRYLDLHVMGIGGERMERAGNFQSLFPLGELSLFGFFEILPSVIKLLWRVRQTARIILREKPDVVLSIDAGEFYFRLHKKIRKKNKTIQLMHLNAPSVWALKPGRAKMVAGFLNHVFALFPFEPPYFTVHGLATTFVGHPLCEVNERISPLDLPLGCTPITVLFGSRTGEVTRLMHDFIGACVLLHKDFPGLFLLIPTFERFQPRLKDVLEEAKLPYCFLKIEEKFSGFKASHAALAASGTVALELAKAQTPFTIAYKLHPLTYKIAQKIIKTPFACLVNIFLKKEVVKEHLQKNCTPESLAHEMRRLLTLSFDEKETLRTELHAAYTMLQSKEGHASEIIADVMEKEVWTEKKL